ncbi:MAG: glycosyltransferase family 39 protein [Acidobacteriota bacterium]
MLRRRTLLLFALAFVIRLIYIAQIRDVVYFDVPLVDGANYFRTAGRIAGGDLAGGPGVFWQPPLYPYFLAVLLSLFGRSLTLIYGVQALVGALSCVLIDRIGSRLFGERAGLIAAVLAAFYAPLIYFDAQPLIPFLHISLMLAGLLLLIRGAGIPESSPAPRRDWAIGGLAWGLSAIATPNILFAAAPVAFWIRRRVGRASWAPVLIFLAGVAAPVLAVTARNAVVAGEFALISSNGGINFYIGNNPDYERTIRIRPGGEFENLSQEPENLGIVSASGKSRYFAGRAVRFLTSYPGQAFRLYLRKVRDLVAGREIPRNQDPYVYREHSGLLAMLLWRFGVAFPFGIVAPLAFAGAFLRGEREGGGRSLLFVLLAAYAISILLFFPTARYRLALIPIALLFAGRLLAAGGAAWKRPAILIACAAGLLLFNLDAATPSERWPEEEAINRAFALTSKNRSADAREEYLRAHLLNPRRIDPINSLAVMAARAGDWEEAERRYRQILDIVPGFVQSRRDLSQSLKAQGRTEEARAELQIAVHMAPGAGLALADLCMGYFEDGFSIVAEPFCERAAQARPDLPEPHFALGVVARSLRKKDVAIRELTEAVRLFPPGHPGRARAEKILSRLR